MRESSNQKPIERKKPLSIPVNATKPSIPTFSSRRRTFPKSSTPTNATARRSNIHHAYNDKGTNIQVVLRCRGRNETELAAESPVILEPSGQKDVLLTTNNKRYTFDRVFDQNTTQEHIYDEVVQPILNQVLEGYNCTIFAYGQTGSGKTYTMEGNLEQRTDDAGIIPRVIYKLFEVLEAEKTEFSIKVSLLELYNEELRDLLNPSNHQQGRQIKIFEDKDGSGVVIHGIDEKYIQTAAEGLDVLRSGIQYRSTGTTKCNDKSSRSHCVFSVTIHIRESVPGKEDIFRIGKLNLVDLAGSENINRSGAEFTRAREAGMINQSLLTLGRVINHLVEKSTHIPYRESKLTRLLKDSLGGKTRTCIIATVSIAKMNQEEISSTLDYANRAKDIRNKPEANQPTNRNIHIRDLELKIEQLKADLRASYDKNGVYMTHKSYELMKEENQQLKDSVKDRQDRLDKARHEATHYEARLRDTLARLDANAKEHDQTVDRIKMEEQQARAQQTDEILDYFGKFDKDLRPLNKEIHSVINRHNDIYQHHIQDDQRQTEYHETDIDNWKAVALESMKNQDRQYKEHMKRQHDLFSKQRRKDDETWTKIQQCIEELCKSRQDSLNATETSLGNSLLEGMGLLESSQTTMEAESKKHSLHVKQKKDEIGIMESELHEDQNRYKKILSRLSSIGSLSEAQQQKFLHSRTKQELRKRTLDEPDKEPVPSKRPHR